ncbi:MAG: fibronectin type III domain-containing protein, partial [Bacteroidia bacterium]|nr:fibronectin type III domain-containing protein [Bacteroidia bacterium]
YVTPEGCEYTAVVEIEIVNNDVSASAAPTAASCPTCTDGRVRLSAFNGAQPYQYSLDGTNFQSDRFFYDLAPGTYNAYVRDAAGCVRTVNFRINACTVPRNFAFEPLTPTSVRISWEAEPIGAPYSLRYRRVGTTSWFIVNNIQTNTFVINNLVLGQSYEYYVTAGCGLSSAIGTYVHALPNCPAPTNISVVVSANNVLFVSWTGSAQEYWVAWTATGQSPETGTSVVVSQNFASLTLPPGAGVYDVYVRARCGAESSVYAVRTVTVQFCPTAQNVALQCSGDRLRGSWTNAETLPSSWTVAWRKNEPGAPWTNALVPGTTLEYLL